MGLVERGRFSLVSKRTVRGLERWAFSGSVLSTVRARPGCVHRDLSGDNLFVLPDGYRVIDWQRPILGPPGVDLASLMASLGFDPVRHAGEGAVRAWLLLNVDWLAQCAARWFPDGTPTYDEQIVRLAARLDDVAR
jgi:aminoglycoside phosphotransferase (APT) family kinase protein